jgi:cytoskeletal protein RodZ
MKPPVPNPERSDADFGGRMRRAREARGVSLRQIADTTKLSMGALEALERNDIARLPGGIFSRAFVRSYASEIGVDPEASVRDFIAQFPHDSVTAGSPHLRSVADGSAGAGRRPTGVIAMACLLLLLLAAAAVYLLPGR